MSDKKISYVKSNTPLDVAKLREAGNDLTQYAIELQNKHNIDYGDLMTITMNILGSMIADFIIQNKTVSSAHRVAQDMSSGLEHAIIANIKHTTEVTRGG